MPNYQSRVNANNDSDKLIGGALDMLSQYEANTSGDQYSSKNPSSKFLDQQAVQSLSNLSNVASGGSEIGGSLVGGAADHLKGGKHMKVAHAVLALTPHAFHALKHTAHGVRHHFHKGSASKTHHGDLDFTTKRGDKDFHRGGHDEKGHPFDKLSGGALEMGAVNDLSVAQHPQHLADMVAKDHEMKGGDFLGTLGSVAKTVLPFLSFL